MLEISIYYLVVVFELVTQSISYSTVSLSVTMSTSREVISTKADISLPVSTLSSHTQAALGSAVLLKRFRKV